jgi:hypothetical protein
LVVVEVVVVGQRMLLDLAFLAVQVQAAAGFWM